MGCINRQTYPGGHIVVIFAVLRFLASSKITTNVAMENPSFLGTFLGKPMNFYCWFNCGELTGHTQSNETETNQQKQKVACFDESKV